MGLPESPLRIRGGARSRRQSCEAGLEAIPVAVDEYGLDVGQLESLDVDAVALSPAHQYPTGAVLTPVRRAQLIAWARRTGALIVEDDYDSEYRYDREPIASLQGLAPDCVAYVGTASKTLAPGVRLGWALVPSHLVGEMAAQHGVARAAPSARDPGQRTRHCSSAVRSTATCAAPVAYHSRRNALIDALAQSLPEASVGGAASRASRDRVAALDGTSETAISDAAARRGVAIHTLHDDCAAHGAAWPRAGARVRADRRVGDPARRQRAGCGRRALARPVAPASAGGHGRARAASVEIAIRN